MTTFKSPHNDRDVEIHQHSDGAGFAIVAIDPRHGSLAVGLHNSIDASVALAVMEAAQHETQNGDPGSADYARNKAINWLMTARDRTAKETAQAVKDATLNRRRDELARALNENCHNFLHATASLQDAIDMILERDDRITNLENQE